jgi:thymidylate synthase (FAD)
MKIIEPSSIILDNNFDLEILKKIERAGRTCYKSEDKITNESAVKFCKSIIKSGHHSVLEHSSVSVLIICDRGVSHEIVRHRIASYSQESTRYCNYSKDKFGNELTFIKPFFWNDDEIAYGLWKVACETSERVYLQLIDHGAMAQEARSVLPNSLKTEIVCTFNIREWRHFFTLRCSPKAHPQMREIAIPLLNKFKEIMPVLFEDIEYGVV